MNGSHPGRLLLVLALAGCSAPGLAQPTGTAALALNPGTVPPSVPPATSTAMPTPDCPSGRCAPRISLAVLGADLDRIGWGVRTDVIMLATVNDFPEPENEIIVWSIPRDLVVWIPCRPLREVDGVEWGRFDRINSAWIHGEREWGPGAGLACVEATIDYNFGLKVAGIGMVDFEGFMDLVDYIGPLEVTPSAYYADWCGNHRNPGGPGRWYVWREGQTYEMDGNLALCYARARNASNDLDRNRRQQDIALAAFKTLLPAIAARMIEDPRGTPPEFVNLVGGMVETDMPPWEMAETLMLALRVRSWPISFGRMRIGEQVAYGHIGPASVLFAIDGEGQILDPSLTAETLELYPGYPGDYVWQLRHLVGCAIYHC